MPQMELELKSIAVLDSKGTHYKLKTLTQLFSDINKCSPNPCQNNGICVDGVNSFSCSCAAGYNGTVCGISESIAQIVFRPISLIEVKVDSELFEKLNLIHICSWKSRNQVKQVETTSSLPSNIKIVHNISYMTFTDLFKFPNITSPRRHSLHLYSQVFESNMLKGSFAYRVISSWNYLPGKNSLCAHCNFQKSSV